MSNETLPLPDAWKPFAKDGTPNVPKSLVTKLAEVMAAVERIPKRGHNQHFNYDFATESDITAGIRKEMAARSLIMTPDVQSVSWREIPTKSAVQTLACLMVRFTVYDGESGQSLSFVVPGEGQDSGDKCIPKAMTSALKYALLKLFMLPTGDDPERDDKPTPAKATTRPLSTRPEPVETTRAHVNHSVSEHAKATIPDGCALVVEVQKGTWGKARGQVILVDSSGVEGKYAVFSDTLAQAFIDAGDQLIVPEFATPKAGGKSYLKGMRLQATDELDSDIPF